jgi:hypothetical protein
MRDVMTLLIDVVVKKCSICAVAVRVIVAATVFDDTSPDLTWNICHIVIWATVEVSLIKVSGMFQSHCSLSSMRMANFL